MKYYLRDDRMLVLEPNHPDEIIQDFRNDEELMYLMKTYKEIIYNIQAPLEWLHPEVSYVEVQNFDIDFKNGEVIIIPELDIEYKPLEDSRLMWDLNKFHKVIYLLLMAIIIIIRQYLRFRNLMNINQNYQKIIKFI